MEAVFDNRKVVAETIAHLCDVREEDMENTAKISIIVPVYNVEAYLPQCLDSLIYQTYSNLEIICINDGSSDGSGDILQEYAAKDSRVVVIEQENQGASVARNSALDISHGDYIMFVDGDDWIDLDTCEVAIKVATQHKADVVFWSYVREYSRGSKEKLMPIDDGAILQGDVARDLLHRRQLGLVGGELAHPEYADSLVTVWGKLYRAELLRVSGARFVDIRKIGTSEDAMFNLQMLKGISRAIYIKRCLYHYRKDNATSVTTRYKENLPLQWDFLFDQMQDYIEEQHLPGEYRQALQNRISLSIVGLGLNIMNAPVLSVKKIAMLREILSGQRYRMAIRTLELHYFPIHWKVFYLCAKRGNAVGIYILLWAIQKMIRRE